MGRNNFQLKKGFTIIEVSLVLAIGGLIFLMVFVALPGLRASQRDTDRREDVTKFITQVKSYQKNNRGALPGGSEMSGGEIEVNGSNASGSSSTWGGFYSEYLGNDFIDPDGEHYNLRVVECGGDTADADCGVNVSEVNFPNDYTMVVVLRGSCKGEGTVRTLNSRKLAVLYKLEGAGTYCSNT